LYGSEIDFLTGHRHELEESIEFFDFEGSNGSGWFVGKGAIAVLLFVFYTWVMLRVLLVW
jgi:hypothetical protein